MAKPRKILYLQHAGAFSGSVMSLLYLLKGLDRSQYLPIIALIRPSQELMELYTEAGFETLPWPGIETFEHTTASWARISSPLTCLQFVKCLLEWKRSQSRTLELIKDVQPDLVHLNSIVLVPSALALKNAGIPFIWHVREEPVPGYWGLRTRFLRNLLKQQGERVIFISQAGQENWVQ